MKLKDENLKKIGAGFLLCAFVFLLAGYFLQNQLINVYQSRESRIIKDRYDREILIMPNQNGYWARYLDEIPAEFKKLLVGKEDKYFYRHFGFNPFSISRAILGRLGIGNREASSTITQQLAKILLGKESERNIKNKIIESFYALAMEIFQTKEGILKMYVNSVYLGNQTQGLSEASLLYFNLTPDLLNEGQMLQLLSTINSPSSNNPAESKNKENAIALAEKLNLNSENLMVTESATVRQNMKNYSNMDNPYFEIKSLIGESKENQLTIDCDLTEKIRDILERNVEELKPKNVNQGAVVVIKLPENEVLSLIGSADPESQEEGAQINMAIEPRPIGSTIKPFIYLKAFEKGLRPYTLVDDREYKYITALGFPLYPKNFDYKYRGEVSLHYSLSNSLNVPAVKVLEYVGLQDFYGFLENDLEFQPIQDLNNYQLGIALGALEMNLYDLCSYFTIFPNEGTLKNVKIFSDSQNTEEKIAPEKYVQLVNKILNDRKTGIEQFGMKSWLNLFQENYALKTGTSRDFRDSWVVGYTPDFLVGVWLGNADNSPTDEVSGQLGAGRIWAQIMELLFNSEYNKKTPFSFDLIKEFNEIGNIEYGLPGDDYEKIKTTLKEKDVSIILNPHNGDSILLEENTKIFLSAKEKAKWYINDEFLEKGENVIFEPKKPGQYRIMAETENGSREEINIFVSE